MGRVLLVLAVVLAPAAIAAQKPLSFAQQVESRVLVLVNELRLERDLKPLERESRLEETAQYFATYMARTGALDHRADGKTPAARVQQRGYRYCVVSENIAYEYNLRGFSSESLARSFFESWRDSPTHRANMLDGAVTQTGIGIARNAEGEYFAAQVFARPASPSAKKGRGCR